MTTSEFVRIELAQLVKRAANQPDWITSRERRLWRLQRWGSDQEIRANWYQHCFRSYDLLLEMFATSTEVAVTREIVDMAQEVMIAFQLDSYDAIHAATALVTRARAIVTLDSDFLRLAAVPDLDVILIRS